jgi:hypothetical protein
MLLLGLLEPEYEGTANIETSIAVNQTTRRNIPEDFQCCSFSCVSERDTSCTDIVSDKPS